MTKTDALIIKLVALAAFFCIMTNFARNPELTGPTIQVPDQNVIELNKVWENKFDYGIRSHLIEDGKIYATTHGNDFYVIDFKTGDLKDSFTLDIENLSYTTIAVSNGMFAVNCDDYIVVYDTIINKQIFKYSYRPYSFEDEILLYDDLLICSLFKGDQLIAINYKTGAIAWTLEKNIQNNQFTLSHFKDKYLYECYGSDSTFQFDPSTGKTIAEYRSEPGLKLLNEAQRWTIPKYDQISDLSFKQWMIDENTARFSAMENGSFYSSYKDAFYFHNQSGDLLWQFRVGEHICWTEDYDKYVFIETDSTLLAVDTVTKEIVWHIDSPQESSVQFGIYEETLYVSEYNGEFTAYSLDSLKEN